MNILLDDLPYNSALFPFAQLRSLAHMRLGICTIFEKWNFYFPGNVFIASEISDDLLQNTRFEKYAAHIIPCNSFLKNLSKLDEPLELPVESKMLQRPWELFKFNDWAIRQDFEMLTHGRTSIKVPDNNKIRANKNIFVEEGAIVNYSIINAKWCACTGYSFGRWKKCNVVAALL